MSKAERFSAEVVAAFGRHLLVRDAGGGLQRARPFGRQLDIVCGDRVACEADGHGHVVVRSVLPRSSELRRSNLRGRSEALVANLSLVVVVLAPVPQPDLFMVDRYLSAAASRQLDALIVLNKQDLPLDAGVADELEALERLGYRVFRVEARAGKGLDALAAALAPHTGVLVGQSGVGKSSLIRRLARDAEEVAIGELMREEEGRHTTTASRLYDCIGGGHLIDSPGVRDYAPSIDDIEPVSLGFHEVLAASAHCRFQDCRHLNEPQCAVAESGAIGARRYESYRRMRRLYDRLGEQRGPSYRPRR